MTTCIEFYKWWWKPVYLGVTYYYNYEPVTLFLKIFSFILSILVVATMVFMSQVRFLNSLSRFQELHISYP